MFCRILGFEPGSYDASQEVEQLSQLFSMIELDCERFAGVEKIKTIGPCVMYASGILNYEGSMRNLVEGKKKFTKILGKFLSFIKRNFSFGSNGNFGFVYYRIC